MDLNNGIASEIPPETGGHHVHADRTYVWENFEQDGKHYSRMTYEWSEDAEPQKGKDFAEALPYDKLPYWRDLVFAGHPVNGLVTLFPEPERSILQSQNIKSILLIPITFEGVSWGYIGFDDCKYERSFPQTDEHLLRSGGTLVVSAILRNRATEDLQEQILAAKRASDASASKSSFLARTSHEIRTPMNAIIGMAELALREEMSLVVRSHVSDIKHAGNSLLAIINDILDFSKIESGKIEITPIHYQFSSLLNDVISIIRIRAGKKGLLFTVNIDNALPDELIGDQVRIRQILINILDNAVKYTGEGHVALDIRGTIDPERKTANLIMSVEDTGRGIKSGDFDKLFQDFVQIDARKNKGIVGTGLGLTVAKGFIEAMDGSITAESEYGHGSKFHIRIPQQIRLSKKIAEVKEPETKFVLIYSDSKPTVDSLQKSCRALNVKCEAAGTHDEFTRLTAKSGFSHILASSAFFDDANRILTSSGDAENLVLLSDYNIPQSKSHHAHSIPIYTISLATLLNDEREITGEYQSEATFTAPDVRVLVVDDNITNLKVAIGLMKPYRMQVDGCTSGAESIKLLQQTRYDLVFMDHMMPDMDGLETTVMIRQMGVHDAYYKDLPIIALTANAVTGMQENFIAHGMNDFLSKPISISRLHRVLEQWIPDEKKQFTEAAVLPEEHNSIPIIEGLNTEYGLQMTRNSIPEYFDLLNSYCREGFTILEKIRESLEENDLSRLAIYAHSLKSSSASIGAQSLSKQAHELEKAGQELNRKAVGALIGGFMRDLEYQIQVINDAIKEDESLKKEQQGQDTMLSKHLLEIKDSLASLDLSLADQLTDRLKEYQWTSEISSLLSDLSDAIIMSEIDSALECLDQLFYKVAICH